VAAFDLEDALVVPDGGDEPVVVEVTRQFGGPREQPGGLVEPADHQGVEGVVAHGPRPLDGVGAGHVGERGELPLRLPEPGTRQPRHVQGVDERQRVHREVGARGLVERLREVGPLGEHRGDGVG
jgi:hypothetical protein